MAITDDYWHGLFERVNREVAAADGTELVFFGDSITWSCSLGPATGQKVWDESYGKYHPINMGNSGDITPVMLYRATHGNLALPAAKAPDVAVVQLGSAEVADGNHDLATKVIPNLEKIAATMIPIPGKDGAAGSLNQAVTA